MQRFLRQAHKQDVIMTSDAEILRRSRLDPAVFGELFDRHASAVHRYLARRAGTPAADDLLSEVFLRALEARIRVRPHESESALPWLYGIGRNVIRGHLRSRDRPSVEAPRNDIDWDAVDARLDASAVAGELRTALESLSDIEREVLLLVSWEQLTITEAAKALDISATAARSRLHRARARAAAALAAMQEANSQETP